MNSENLFDSITNIDDELIKEAGEYTLKKKKKSLIPVLISFAAAFAVIVALGMIAKNGGFGGNPSVIPDDTTTEESVSSDNEKEEVSPVPFTLAKARYPERAKYPVAIGGTSENDERDSNYRDKYEAWHNDLFEVRRISVETDNITEFSKKITAEYLTGKEGENKACSPLNIYMALAMLSEACEGESREQILSLLGVDSTDELREQANKIWQKNYRDDGVMKAVLGNSLWLDDGIDYNKSTVARIAEKYYASVFRGEMGSVEYNSVLNNWISEQTDGLIPADIEMQPETVLAIASTLLYTSKWNDEFLPEKTTEGVFYAPSGEKNAEYMNALRQMYYYWGEGFAAIALPMDIGGNMWFILPDEGVSADSIFADPEVMELIFSQDNALGKYENSKYIKVNMSIPKFDITCNTDLTEGFFALGIADITDPLKADFSSLIPDSPLPVWVDKAEHGVRVKIDEEGVSAAAYTVLMEAGAAMPPDEIADFILDRPFAFAVTLDYETLLFAGVVNEPVE